MTRNAKTIEEKAKQLRLEALRYCETADRNLKLALLEAEQRIKQAKQEFMKREQEVTNLSKNFAMGRVAKIVEFTKRMVDQKPVDLHELKPGEVEALHKYFVPYIQQLKVVELRQKEFDLVKEKIEVNAKVYMLYKQEAETADDS
ncbi:uncharacterized protein BXIN_0415 [Babesia sp. Xinjiang]|uniref:uncharacterized protein n=1 Tax=Babesia sp. Xinjiang TaxID=462227 RepID=UPI000A23C60C|nr:uncharacterized protein BXIN_0415 [Babesia sp. Xinjiang]ORM41082.1 hypothetical protein BXIN_0415 [Babesia sp. Xinjiang]